MADVVNKLLPDILIFLKELVKKETLSEESVEKCDGFIELLEEAVKQPYIDKKSQKNVSAESLSDNKTADAVKSLEFLHEQRELSRQGTIWKSQENRPQLKPYDSQKENVKTEKPIVNERIYERIGSISNTIDPPLPPKKQEKNKTKDEKDSSDDPPPVPERKGRTSSAVTPKSPLQQRAKLGNNEVVLVHDLKAPLYSGLLRNVRENIKQWCVIKKQKLYLFNDLTAPAVFIADLHEYEIFKDIEDINTFRISRIGEASLILAAVDDEQYELWHYAFRRAKALADSMDGLGDDISLRDYISFRGSEEFDDPYEKPEDLKHSMQNVLSPGYVPMDGYSHNIPSLSPIDYEVMDYPPNENPKLTSETTGHGPCDYSAMPLPPLPNTEDLPPELPARTRLKTQTNTGTRPFEDDDDDENSDLSASGSFEQLDESEIYDRSKQMNTLQRKIKNRTDKEVEFLRDLSAVFCGILHQRRLLAVWQKRFCKVKDQTLLCYRSPDANEPVLRVELPLYHIDRADETWKSHAFKMYKDPNEVLYFAAETRADMVKWINILVKESEKKKNTLDVPDSRDQVSSLSDDSFSPKHISLKKEDSVSSIRSAQEDEGSSDFDADNESIDSDITNDEAPLSMAKNKLLRRTGRKGRARTDAMKDPNAEIQGFLYRKLNNHWSKRWCCIKDEKFMSYKRSTRDPPEFMVLLSFAALALPKEDEVYAKTNQHYFRLRYEGDVSIVFRTSRKETWNQWIAIIGKYIGSQSEEEFHYINVPPGDSDRNSKLFEDQSNQIYTLPRQRSLTAPKSLPSSKSFELPPRVPLTPSTLGPDNPPQREPNEIEEAFHSGMLTELQMYNQAFRHIDRFVVLAESKMLKIYPDKESVSPVAWFSGLDITVIEESGADSTVLRLLIETSDTELVFKAFDSLECSKWKKAFDKLHYEEIDDIVLPPRINDDIDMKTHEKIFRKRSKSIERKDKTEPVLLSHSKTLPHLGKNKRIAKEIRKEKEKARTLPNETNALPASSRKSFSALIRSFTVDTISRKAKNKNFENKDDNIASIKETQNGFLDELIVDDLGNILLIQRFCRISGKVFYAYESESDKKPLLKIPLRNAAIEERSDVENHIYQFSITEMDTGKEYTFALSSEEELDTWSAALFGEDILHKTFETSPNTSMQELNEQHDDSRSSPFDEIQTPVSVRRPPIKSPKTSTNVPPTTNLLEVKNNSLNDMKATSPIPEGERHSGSVSSLHSTSRSTLSETETPLSPLSTGQRSFDEGSLKNFMIESQETGKSKTRRWVVLKDNCMYVYKNERAETPVNTLQLNEYTLLNANEKSSFCIKLKHKLGGVIEYFLPTESIQRRWLNELKRCMKKKSSTSMMPVILRNRNVLADRLRLSEKDKRASLVLIDDDVRAIEEYEKNTDPQNTMSGVLFESIDEFRKDKERFCWIKSGYFYIAKRVKPDKPIKVIDLSTVVVLDESDSGENRFSFKLEYQLNGKPASVLLNAQNATIAEKWMVGVSMGILFHRLSTNNRESSNTEYTRSDNDEDMTVHDFGFVKLGEDTEEEVARKMRKDSTDPKLSVDIKRAINMKALHGSTHLQPVSELLNTEFPSPDRETFGRRKIKSDKVDGIDDDDDDEEFVPITVLDENFPVTQPDASLVPPIEVDTRLSMLKDEDDKVFNETAESTTAEDLLENIPERENANETFKNVKGILRQQESIRRAILKRQRVDNDDQSRKNKTPPLIKPKPKLLKPLSFTRDAKFIVLKTNLEELSMNELQSYKEELEEEKARLVKNIRRMSVVVSEARTNLKRSRSMRENSTSSEKELNIVTTDLQTLQTRFQRIEKELKTINTHVNRKVAATMTSRRKSNTTWYYGSTHSLHDTKDDNKSGLSSHHEEGYNSEPILDEKYPENNNRDSIIV